MTHKNRMSTWADPRRPTKGSEPWFGPSKWCRFLTLYIYYIYIYIYIYIYMTLHGNNRLLWAACLLPKHHLALPKRHLTPSKTFRLIRTWMSISIFGITWAPCWLRPYPESCGTTSIINHHNSPALKYVSTDYHWLDFDVCFNQR